MGAGIFLFWRLGNAILCTGTGIHETKTIEQVGMGFQFEQQGWDCGI